MTLIFSILAVLVIAFLARPLFAASANATLNRFVDQELRSYPVGAAVHIYRDTAVGVDPAGHLKAFVPGDVFVGIAYEECDNSAGAAAALNCRVYVLGDFELPLTSVAKTDTGRPLFATADNTFALTGHPDAYVGRILNKERTDYCVVRLKSPGERPPNGFGSVTLQLTGHESFTATGATAGTSPVGAFDLKSILGPGFAVRDAEDGGIALAFDATAEIALASVRTPNDILPIDKGLTAEFDMCVTDKGDAAAVDLDIGFGTALTTNSEASVDHADMVQLFAVHMDGASDNILLQSDDNTTDVAPADTTIDNDSTTDVPKHFKLIVRPTGVCECWIDGVRVLSSTAFAMLSTANVAFFANAEKTSDDTTFECVIRNLTVKAGCAA